MHSAFLLSFTTKFLEMKVLQKFGHAIHSKTLFNFKKQHNQSSIAQRILIAPMGHVAPLFIIASALSVRLQYYLIGNTASMEMQMVLKYGISILILDKKKESMRLKSCKAIAKIM